MSRILQPGWFLGLLLLIGHWTALSTTPLPLWLLLLLGDCQWRLHHFVFSRCCQSCRHGLPSLLLLLSQPPLLLFSSSLHLWQAGVQVGATSLLHHFREAWKKLSQLWCPVVVLPQIFSWGQIHLILLPLCLLGCEWLLCTVLVKSNSWLPLLPSFFPSSCRGFSLPILLMAMDIAPYNP